MKPMWTLAVSAITVTLSVAETAMLWLSLLTWMVGVCERAGAEVARMAAARAKAGRWRIFVGFIGLFLLSRGDRQKFFYVLAWRLASAWDRAGRVAAEEFRPGRARWT